MSGNGSDEVVHKRLRMRSWRRGMKEMDLILGPFADAALSDLSDAALELYEAMLSENDQDLYGWVTGTKAAPEAYRPLIERLRAFHRIA
jgi:antitoxin CptB